MFTNASGSGFLVEAVWSPSERSGEGLHTAAGGRSIASWRTRRRRRAGSSPALSFQPGQPPEPIGGPCPVELVFAREGVTMNATDAIFVGIDVSKAQLDVAVLPNGRRSRVDNDRQGAAQLIRQLEPIAPSLIVIESTGGYERLIITELLAVGLPVALVNPRQVRDFARGIGQLAKTDTIDAEVLALFAKHVQPRLLEKTPKKQAELEQPVTRRRRGTQGRPLRSCRVPRGSGRSHLGHESPNGRTRRRYNLEPGRFSYCPIVPAWACRTLSTRESP